ncbi:3-hydroxyisobutyrate dehydrogenase [Thermostaphylospora chromogena]|uniref:3-hydroxyisobutyrate dehydrogenase n=2 Tax=Thermostaphylospora chromogena TaxID=35622 RepID=A0A1H1HEH5_9ACTN|nr:3-hydroxyisobutyrate dehydrogenase [Thermostaphylospora chromogena]
MGTPMAARLVAAGYDVTVWNRTPKTLEGASAAPSAAEAVEGADIVITMLRDPAAVEEVLGSVRPRPGSVVVEMSTIGPEAVARLRAALPADVDLVDAPVLGSVGPAASGELTVLAGGDVTRCREVLEVFGRVRTVGPLGSGAALKLAVMGALVPAQVLMAETLADAAERGIDPLVVLEVLEGTPLGALAGRLRPVVESGTPGETRYALGLAAKDVTLAVESGDGAGGTLTLAAAARRRLSRAVEDGLGEQDLTAIVPAVRAGAGRPPAGAGRLPEKAGPEHALRLNPPTVVPTNGRYSHAVRSGNTLFVAGQVAVDADGKVIGEGDIVRQSEVVFENLRLILADQGCTFRDVTFIRTFLTDMDLLLEHARVRQRYITEVPPASTTVEVSRLFKPGLLLEVELTAVIPG